MVLQIIIQVKGEDDNVEYGAYSVYYLVCGVWCVVCSSGNKVKRGLLRDRLTEASSR